MNRLWQNYCCILYAHLVGLRISCDLFFIRLGDKDGPFQYFFLHHKHLLQRTQKESMTAKPPYFIISAEAWSIPGAFSFFKLLIVLTTSCKVIFWHLATVACHLPSQRRRQHPGHSHISLKYPLHRLNALSVPVRMSPSLDLILFILDATEELLVFLTSIQKFSVGLQVGLQSFFSFQTLSFTLNFHSGFTDILTATI